MTSNQTTIVIGDGWAALGLVGFLSLAQKNVVWITGSGARFDAPLPTLEVSASEQAALTWKNLAQGFGVETGELMTGSFLREFRNKAFREPAWTQAPTPEDRKEVRNEVLWAPEKLFAPVFEARFNPSIAEIEAAIREKLTGIRRIEGVPVQSIQIEGDRVIGVTLASGEAVACEQVFFADRWSGLAKIEGMPKAMPFTRKRGEMGVLQAVFTHDLPDAADLKEGFFGALHKDAGEEIERHVWGFFSSDGAKSFWTVCLSQEETEDNHVIAKKLRRMKGALEKMFAGTGMNLAEPSVIKSEQVRFEESVIFSEGEPLTEPARVKSLTNISFLTDGYGPASAMSQVAAAVPVFEAGTHSQGEGIDAGNADLA